MICELIEDACRYRCSDGVPDDDLYDIVFGQSDHHFHLRSGWEHTQTGNPLVKLTQSSLTYVSDGRLREVRDYQWSPVAASWTIKANSPL